MLCEDIASSSLYIIEREGKMAGVFYFAVTEDSTYSHIEGRWSSEMPYGVVHRIAASAGFHGILSEALSFAFSRVGYVRIDTHRDSDSTA